MDIVNISSTMRVPDFTIVMPVHEERPELILSVDSILAQSLGSFELLIVNDGCPVEPANTLLHVLDPRLKFLRSKGNGPGAARNTLELWPQRVN